MNYKLKNKQETKKGTITSSAIKKLLPFLSKEKKNLLVTGVAVLVSSGANLIAPILIGYTIDHAMALKDFQGILINSAWLLLIFLVGSGASYIQTKAMGGVGRRLLFDLRNMLFNKLQSLPVEFFNQNASGDLISRINNDTDKLNQFFSQALMQFIGNFFLILGTGIFILFLHFQLAFVTLLPALGILVLSLMLSPWVKRKNLESFQSLGNMSSEIQESLGSFKVMVAFHRLDYFRKKFETSNQKNYTASIMAGIANNTFTPIYGLASNLAGLISLCYGLYLIGLGELTIGLLISFQLYVNNFYAPLRQLASIWASFQSALASLDRIWEIVGLESNLPLIPSSTTVKTDTILAFQSVSYHYPEAGNILKMVSFSLQKGKTYALVGPTGGGKTTTASLMARLYDPSEGVILLDGQDLRSYEPNERVQKIGFILQEPFLFSGTLKENIWYGNEKYLHLTEEQRSDFLKQSGLFEILSKFESGLDTEILTGGDSISLGQKQLIAFIRACLREPDLLILDEATANIDTVTEQLLDTILQKLPKTTTKVIIAHRLNTIQNADEIFFVNSGVITQTGSMQQAMELLLSGKRES